MDKQKTQKFMTGLASLVDEVLNGPVVPKPSGFCLLVYPFGCPDGARINYIGSGSREETLVALKELVARWEGQYAEPPEGSKQ